MQPQDIQKLIEENLQNCRVFLDGDGRHFNAIVISSDFEGKNRVQKQQLVYAALGDRIDNGTIHALSFKTFTPEEWDKHNKES